MTPAHGTTPAVVEKVTVTHPFGLHLRAAAKLILLKRKFQSHVTLRKGKESAPADSILGLMNLAAGHGAELELICEGEDAGEAAAEIRRFFANPQDWF